MIVDVGNLGKKLTAVTALRDEFKRTKKPAPEIVYVDCTHRASASKLPAAKKK